MHHAVIRIFTQSAALIGLALACAAPTIQAETATLEPRPIQAQVQPQRVIEDSLLRDPLCRESIPGKTFARTELFFGLSRPGGVVTEQEFQIFVDQFVAPRFPGGLTLLAGTGQFRDASGATISEGSKLLILLYPGHDRDASGKIEQIRADYKDQFQQQSVLRADDIYCVSF